jgi:hypothetical protein
MNKFLRPVSWVLPGLLGLLIVSTFTLSGCGGGPGEPPINLDSVSGHVIPIKDAIALTTKFRNTVDTLNAHCPGFKDSFLIGRSEAFNRDSYWLLLRQKDSSGHYAAGIRIYYGLDAKGVMKLVMVPYSRDGYDIIKNLISADDKPVPGVSPAKVESLSTGGAQALEQGQLCPTVCPPISVLNP